MSLKDKKKKKDEKVVVGDGKQAVKVFLLDNSYKTFIADSSMTIGTLTPLCYPKFDIENPGCFFIFENSLTGERALDSSEKVFDLLESWKKKKKGNETCRFLFKKVLFVQGDVNISHAKTNKMFYFQASWDVLNGFYPIPEWEAFSLAALRMQIILGDHNGEVQPPGYLFQHPEKFQNLLPPAIMLSSRGKNLKELEKLLTQKHELLSGKSAEECMLEYVKMVRGKIFYGMHVFQASIRPSNQHKYKGKVALGIGFAGISLFRDVASEEVIKILKFSHITAFGRQQPSGFGVRYGSKRETAIPVLFETNEGSEIAAMVQRYVQFFADERKRKSAEKKAKHKRKDEGVPVRTASGSIPPPPDAESAKAAAAAAIAALPPPPKVEPAKSEEEIRKEKEAEAARRKEVLARRAAAEEERKLRMREEVAHARRRMSSATEELTLDLKIKAATQVTFRKPPVAGKASEKPTATSTVTTAIPEVPEEDEIVDEPIVYGRVVDLRPPDETLFPVLERDLPIPIEMEVMEKIQNGLDVFLRRQPSLLEMVELGLMLPMVVAPMLHRPLFQLYNLLLFRHERETLLGKVILEDEEGADHTAPPPDVSLRLRAQLPEAPPPDEDAMSTSELSSVSDLSKGSGSMGDDDSPADDENPPFLPGSGSSEHIENLAVLSPPKSGSSGLSSDDEPPPDDLAFDIPVGPPPDSDSEMDMTESEEESSSESDE